MAGVKLTLIIKVELIDLEISNRLLTIPVRSGKSGLIL